MSPPRTPITAIIAAGGRGDRAESHVPKQFSLLGDRPLVSWSLETLRLAGCDAIVLVVPSDHVASAAELTGDRTVRIVEGGTSRQESVGNGLRFVDNELVLVHDAARPFVQAEMIDGLLAGLGDADGVLPVLPVHETVKEVFGSDVRRTVDRDRLVLSQTPQLFRSSVLLQAHERARSDGFVGTDDAQLVERNGGIIKTVPGARRNIKLTYPEDFELAERMVRSG